MQRHRTEWSNDQDEARRARERERRVEMPQPGGYSRDEERAPVASYERANYGIGDRGMDQQADWRGPGEMAGYREASDPRRARPFSQASNSGGQIPGEMREWGRRGDRGERRIQGEYPMREPWRHGPAGPGPDADRGPDGRRRSLAGGSDVERGPHAGRGPRNYRRADARVHEEICDRLMQHPHIDASDIEVEVTEGRVVLAGTVPDRATKHRAEDVVEAVFGVNEIDNRLRVGRAGATSAPRDDQQ